MMLALESGAQILSSVLFPMASFGGDISHLARRSEQDAGTAVGSVLK